MLMILAAPCARAAQPLVTDDAAVLAPNSCQLEVWARSSHDRREYWALPACNIAGNVELTAGGARTDVDRGAGSSNVQVQAKAVLLQRTDLSASFGVEAGATRDTGAPHGSSAFQTYYVTALATWHPRHDLEIDLNLGGVNLYGTGTLIVGGAAIQYAVKDNLQLLAEMFRDEPGRAKYQVGARWIAIPDRLEAFASFGNRLSGSGDRTAIVGVRLQTPPLTP